jgi:hypothetical protein
VIRSSETSVHIRNTQRYIPEDEKHALLPLWEPRILDSKNY